MNEQTKARIKELQKEKDVVILAHYYVDGEVQEIADYVGDSYYLAKVATTVEQQNILFCGVSFMGKRQDQAQQIGADNFHDKHHRDTGPDGGGHRRRAVNGEQREEDRPGREKVGDHRPGGELEHGENVFLFFADLPFIREITGKRRAHVGTLQAANQRQPGGARDPQ